MMHFRLPRDGETRPTRLIAVAPIDTGGSWRPNFRPQDPNKDPAEPGGGESSSVGTDHGWANCTMAAGAMAYAYDAHATGDDAGPWGGNMRHSQDDLSGGTDLSDLQTAWQRYGNRTLNIRSGDGWGAVEQAHDEGRAIVIQGEGNCPGAGTFTGGHACCIGPETDSRGYWLWGDPDTTGWQWVSPSSIKEWAQRLSSSIAFATSEAGDGAMREVDMQASTPKRVDLPEGIMILNLDGSERLTNKSRRNGVYAPFTTYSDGGTIMYAIQWTRADPDPDLLLAVYGNSVENVTDYVDSNDADISDRDDEWRAWLLDGSPGS